MDVGKDTTDAAAVIGGAGGDAGTGPSPKAMAAAQEYVEKAGDALNRGTSSEHAKTAAGFLRKALAALELRGAEE